MKNHKIWPIIILVLVALIAGYFIKKSSQGVTYVTVPVVRGSISEVVSVTGNVKPLSDVDLAFEKGGRVAVINVSVGDKVSAGEELASVSNADLLASLDQAKANLKIAQAQNPKVNTAELNLSQNKISLVNAVKDAYTQADDALRNKIYSLFTDPNRYRAKLSFNTDAFLKEDIENGKDTAGDSLDSWYQSLAKLTNASDLEKYYGEAKTNLLAIKALLDKCATAVNGLTPETAYTTQAQIDAWKGNISLARTNINVAVSSLNGSYDQYQTAILALSDAQNSFKAEEATIEQAQAGVASAQAELTKSIIKSPIDGVITNIIPKLGEIVPAGQNAISVISYGDYEVEAFVPEADIAKVKIGNMASTTLDAYGANVDFETTVIKIDPAATVIDGVPTYKVTLRFTGQDDRVKSGMTANLDILTNHQDGVLILPSRLVNTNDNGKYVTIVNPTDRNKTVDKKVVTGLRGADGNVEIISGLNAGDEAVPAI